MKIFAACDSISSAPIRFVPGCIVGLLKIVVKAMSCVGMEYEKSSLLRVIQFLRTPAVRIVTKSAMS
jgi:hypothetical protein